MEKLTIDDLGLSFADIDTLNNEEVKTNSNFGPTKDQLKTFAQLEGCDGKFLHPFNFTSDRIGKISDFVSAAINEAREKEREQDREKKKEETTTIKKKVKIVRDDPEEDKEENDDDFTVIEDNRAKQKTRNPNQGNWNQ